MRIVKYGTVTFVEGSGPKIEGWLVEIEPEDPKDAAPEQLVQAFAIHWAKKKFEEALNSATMQWLRDAAKKKVLEKLAIEEPKN